MSDETQNKKEAENKEKPKKPKLTSVQILARAADLLHAAKYNTFTESSYKEYELIEFGVRRLLRKYQSFKEEKENEKQQPDKVKHDAPTV